MQFYVTLALPDPSYFSCAGCLYSLFPLHVKIILVENVKSFKLVFVCVEKLCAALWWKPSVLSS